MKQHVLAHVGAVCERPVAVGTLEGAFSGVSVHVHCHVPLLLEPHRTERALEADHVSPRHKGRPQSFQGDVLQEHHV